MISSIRVVVSEREYLFCIQSLKNTGVTLKKLSEERASIVAYVASVF